MRKIAGLGFVATALLPGLALAQARQFRYFLTYRDSELVRLARSTGSDPAAEIGGEIPVTVRLSVPTMGSFTVGLAMQHLANGLGPVYLNHFRSFIAYDRALLSNGAFLSAPPLDQNSFRKISPLFTGSNQLRNNLSNFGSGIVYDLNRNTIDIDLDGQPDIGTYGTNAGRGSGAYVSGNDGATQVRGAGTAFPMTPDYDLLNGFIGSGWFKVLPEAIHHICDATYVSNLEVGEVFGSSEGETGLLLHTTGGEQNGNGNNMGFYRLADDNPEPWQNIGAKYTLIGAAPVPEPGVMLGLLAGLGILIRRRH
ncbi:MAG: PEP-CTERM sorting domain-containing protein [Chthonomonas sp.]|nr:PEP-CTERM sorting domain-containing protein [Chthonomonas sp.]